MIVLAFILNFAVDGLPLGALFWSVIFITFLPFAMALLSSLPWRSFWRLCKTYIFYFLFIPTFVGGFQLYADARFWDLRWGNRETTEESAHRGATAQEAEALRNRIRWDSLTILICE